MDRLTGSPQTQLARAFAARVSAAHGFAFWKGRVGLYAILRALRIGPGDEVILPGFTCVVVQNPIAYVGATTVFTDIVRGSYNANAASIERKITPRTRALVVQHSFGIPSEVEPIVELAKKHRIDVIEDCCLALGSTVAGRPVGTFGRAAYWSFQWSKTITSGLGGVVTTSDQELAERIESLMRSELIEPTRALDLRLSLERTAHRAMAVPGIVPIATAAYRSATKLGVVTGSSSPEEFDSAMPTGFFRGMGTRQAGAALRALSELDLNVAHRRRTSERYSLMLDRAGWPVREFPAGSVLVRYPIEVEDKAKVVARAARAGIELGTWFESPLHPKETNLAAHGYSAGSCPEGERVCAQLVNLPTHPRVSDAVAESTVDFVRSCRPANQP
ncbi:MAG: DegT/DnrJ/EryC1/StrS family aminotransferase [Deltaproteobacteria bacterium]|nr:DegT/DnrJ/EryC1/StrS family aminotransferase [Deltaproteobacteria bacterium]